MSSPSSAPNRLASASAQLFMGYEANMDAQKDIVDIASRLELSAVPDEFSQTLSGIELQGEVPFSMQSRLGNDFTQAEVTTDKKLNSEANVSITLASPVTQLGLRIFSTDEEVEFGMNKKFKVFRPFDKRQIGQMPFQVLADFLDSVVPATDNGQISKLAEERFALPFDSIAVHMGDILRDRAKKSTSMRRYMAFALLNMPGSNSNDLLDPMVDQLKVETAGPVTMYTLESFQPLFVGGGFATSRLSDSESSARPIHAGRIIKHVRYSFKDARYHENTARRSRKNVNADIKVSLLSPDFAKPVLDRFVQRQQEDFEAGQVFTRALGAILQSRPAPDLL